MFFVTFFVVSLSFSLSLTGNALALKATDRRAGPSVSIKTTHPPPLDSEVTDPPDDSRVMVEGTPPPPLNEVEDPNPGPGSIWRDGYWKWEGRWKWQKGGWILKPSEDSVWVPGFWKKNGHHWVWVDGHWA